MVDNPYDVHFTMPPPLPCPRCKHPGSACLVGTTLCCVNCFGVIPHEEWANAARELPKSEEGDG